MNDKNASRPLPVFPLNVFLLPGGITRLRIFEQRYLRMVKGVSPETGFILSFYSPQLEFQTSTWGARVKIVDFDTLPDGLLSIDIQAEELVCLDQMYVEEDGLRFAKWQSKAHWQIQQMENFDLRMVDFLTQVFRESETLQTLYKNTTFDDARWVCSRCLELVPLPAIDKIPFIDENSFDQAVSFLQTIVLGEIKK